jgi:hypothetical protein
MSLVSTSQSPISLGERLRDTPVATPSLIAEVIRKSCRRFPSLAQTAKTERIEQLIGLGAWTDAALALIELELPQWRVRRLVYDSGEWYCALSRERELPDWLDDSVDGRHADLALAILSALVEVQHNSPPAHRSSVPPAGRGERAHYEPLCCDSFA